jgi:phosphatidylglycerophosphate synthase
MVTAFGLILGLAAAPLVATGDPWLMALAVFLWQTSSMVDGIDGELARMRMSPSHSGEWFDTVADDITNIAFLAGLGYGIGQISNNPLYFYVAAGICGMMVISCSWFYREFVKMGIASHNHFEWGFEAENKENKENEHRNPIRKALDLIAGGFAWIAKRDFYTFLIMCLVMAGACFSPLYYAAYFIMLIGASFVGIGGISALTLRAIRNRKK